MTRSKAAAVMRAAELARNAERRVKAARTTLTVAEKARTKAEENYLTLVRESLGSLELRSNVDHPKNAGGEAGEEGTQQ